jgi:hypothetical protein
MNRRVGVRIAGVLLLLLAVVGVWQATHATYGSVSGFHVVDGHWLGPETSCSDANAPDYCATAIVTATAAFAAQGPHAQVLRSTIAPQSCDGSTYVICTNGGMGTTTLFVVFDLTDGSRHAVGLLCQTAISVNDQPSTPPNCQPDNITNLEVGSPSGS